MLAHARSQYDAVVHGDYDRESFANGALIQAMENVGPAYYLARITRDARLENEVLSLRGKIMKLLERKMVVSFPSQPVRQNPAHMIPEYLEGPAWAVDTTAGIWYVPGDLVRAKRTRAATIRELGPYVEGDIVDFEWIANAVLARLSAPGYIDATEWVGFKTLREAERYIEDTYEVDAQTGEPFAEEGL